MASKSAKRKPVTAPRSASRSRTKPSISKPAVKRANAATPSFAQQSAKLYHMPFPQEDMGEAARAASESMRQTAESMMKASNDMMQQLFANSEQAKSSNSAYTAQSQAFDYTKNAFEQFTKSAGTSSASVNEMYELLRENIAAMVACANIAADLSKQLAAHSVAFSNQSFSQHVELSKQALSCRTLNDLFDLSSKYAKTFFDNFFSESIAISELLFQTASDISEPVNERINESAERVSQMMRQ
jgi:hypothetical protein